MSWKVVFTKQAQKDARKLAATGLKAKAEELLSILCEDPWQSPPPLEKLLGDLKVFIEFNNRTVEHVRLEERAFPFCDALAGSFEQWLEETFNLLRVAVVGVKRDEHVVFLSEQVSGFGENDRTESSVCDFQAGSELAATCGNLDDAVGLRVRE